MTTPFDIERGEVGMSADADMSPSFISSSSSSSSIFGTISSLSGVRLWKTKGKVALVAVDGDLLEVAAGTGEDEVLSWPGEAGAGEREERGAG